MTNLIKTFLDLFIAASLLITFGQDIYRMTATTTSSVRSPSHDSSSPDEVIPSQSQIPTTPQIEGIIILVTDNLRKPLQELLTAEKYNIKTESYKFDGPEWWFDTVLTYGHMILVYFLMSKYKTETNQSTKKKIMYAGGLIVVGWMFLMPYLKQARLSVQVKGVNVYTKDSIVPNEIISIIADGVEVPEFNDNFQIPDGDFDIGNDF